MNSDTISSPASRLRESRISAGFKSATAAAEHFGWKTPTYISHENGARGFRPVDAEKYARAFDVDAGWLVTGRRAGSFKASAPAEPAGFADRIEPYIPPRDGVRVSLNRLTENIAPSARATQFLIVPHHYPGLCLMQGDVIVIDQQEIRPRPGTVVVCQVVDTQTGEGSTELKLFGPGGPVSPCGERELTAAQEQSVIGSVIYCLRGAPGV